MKKEVKKYFILVLVILLTISITAVGVGCKEEVAPTEEATEEAPAEEATEEAPAEEATEELKEPTDEPITINLWNISSQATTPQWQAWIDYYTAKHPNVTVNMSTYEYGVLVDIAESAIASGAENMDMCYNNSGAFTNMWARDGIIRNLDDLYDKYGWHDLMVGETKYYETPGLGYNIAMMDGIVAPAVYYNKDIIKEAGIELPLKNLDELFEAGKKIQDAGYIPWLNCQGQIRFFRFFNWVLARMMGMEDYNKMLFWGEDPDRTLESAEIFRSQEVVDAYEFMLKMQKEGMYTDGFLGIDTAGNTELFASGKAAFAEWGSWAVGTWEEYAPDIDVGTMNLPPVKEGDTDLFVLSSMGAGMVIPSYVSDEKVAVIGDWLNEIYTNKDVAIEAFNYSNYSTVEFEIEELEEAISPVALSIYAMYKENGGSLLLDHWMEASLRTKYEEIIDLILVEKITPEEAAQKLYEAAIDTLE